MVKIRKYANGIERFLHGEKGQRFFNFAYSIGAAIVIWGALFKILHLPGGNTLLCIGMGTEIAMFILTAFDRPPKDYNWEEVFPVLDPKHAEATNHEENGNMAGGAYPVGGGTIVIGGGSLPSNVGGVSDGAAGIVATGGNVMTNAVASADLSSNYIEQLKGISEQMEMLQETTRKLNEASAVLLESYRAITGNSDNISGSAAGYADRMEELNRNIGGLNTIYEIQLKSVSSQIETIDRVNRSMKDIRDMYEKSAGESSRYCEETEKMARYMKQLNSVYEKMLTAMTINMHNPMMGAGAAPSPFTEKD